MFPNSARQRCMLSLGLKKRCQLSADCSRVFCHAVRVLNKKETSATKQSRGELPTEALDTAVRSKERREVVGRDAVDSYETNELAANAPCEDHYSEGKCLTTGGYLFGIFDGHGGSSCSRAVSRRLYDYVSTALLPREVLRSLVCGKVELREAFEFFFCSAGTELSDIFSSQHEKNVLQFAKHCLDNPELFGTVRKSIQQAFEGLDKDISSEALPDSRGQLSPSHVSVATCGTCGILAHIRGPNLHIGNVGDSSAVLAVCTESGSWTARRLNNEHCIDNPVEVKRIRSEHPAREASTVLRGGRLLGELFPLRAFGDVRYKWSVDLQTVVLGPLLRRNSLPQNFETPPYLTAHPEVFYHKLTPNDRFLILASDGLWELLTPEKAVRLVSDHMVGRETLTSYMPDPHKSVSEVLADLRLRKQGKSKRPIDLNSATHLIRHALGGDKLDTQYYNLNTMLRLPAGIARNYRDDISVTVVYFDAAYLASSDC